MNFFRKKNKAKRPNTSEIPLPGIHSNDIKKNSNHGQRSKVDEKILRNGPDTGFVWYEEA